MSAWEVKVDLNKSSRSGSVDSVSPLRVGTASDETPVHGGSAVSVVPIHLGSATSLRSLYDGCFDKVFYVFEELHFFKPGFITFSVVNDAVFLLVVGVRGETNSSSSLNLQEDLFRTLKPYDLNGYSSLNNPRVDILRPKTIFDNITGSSVFDLQARDLISRPLSPNLTTSSSLIEEKDASVSREVRLTVDPIEIHAISKPGTRLRSIGGLPFFTIIPEPNKIGSTGTESTHTFSIVETFLNKSFNVSANPSVAESLTQAIKATVNSELVAELILGKSSFADNFSSDYIARSAKGEAGGDSSLEASGFMVDIVAYVNEMKGRSDLTEADSVVDGAASRTLNINDINNRSELNEILSQSLRSILPQVLNTSSSLGSTKITSSFDFRPKIFTSSFFEIDKCESIRNLDASSSSHSEFDAPLNFNVQFPQLVNEAGSVFSTENDDIITTKQTDYTQNDTVEV